MRKGLKMHLDSKYLDNISNTSFQPIFILGFHRSGTSILYKMLTATGCFNPVTTYHIIKYDELLHNHINKKSENVKQALNKFFKNYGQRDRGIDRLQLSADFNEEYCFVFTKKSYKPYMNVNNISLFKELCKKIQFISNNDKLILLKNPYDFTNFMFIKKVFPSAKFIFIHRNPVKVFSSYIRSLSNLYKKKSQYNTLLSEDYKKYIGNPISLFLIRFLLFSSTLFLCLRLIRKSKKTAEYYLENINLLDEDSYVEIRYEDLCENPPEEMSKIMNYLGLKSKLDINYNEFVKPRKIDLIKELKILQPYIVKKMKKYYSHCGYDNTEG